MFLGRCFTAAALACVLTAAPATGWGQGLPVPTITEQTAAQSAVLDRIEKAKAGKGALPRMSNPDDARLLRSSFDYRSLANLSLEDSEITVCENALTVAQAYYSEGANPSEDDNLGQSSDQAGKTAGNASNHHDELILSMSYLIDCFGGFMAPSTALWNSLDDATKAQARPSVLLFRNGSAGVVEGAVSLLGDTRFSSTNKVEIVAALVRTAPAYAAAMTLTQRTTIRNRIDTVVKGIPPALVGDINNVRAIFDIKTCTGLCAI